MITKCEGVLDVKLELVESKFGQQIDQLVDRFHGRNLTPAASSMKPLVLSTGASLISMQEVLRGRLTFHKLRKCGEGSENSVFLSCGKQDAIRRNSQFIGFGAGETFFSDQKLGQGGILHAQRNRSAWQRIGLPLRKNFLLSASCELKTVTRVPGRSTAFCGRGKDVIEE